MKKITAISIILSLFILSCKDKNKIKPNDGDKPAIEYGTLNVSANISFNKKLLHPTNPTEDTIAGGRKIIINDAKIFLSNFQFENEGGKLVFPEQGYLLFQKFSITHDLGKIPVGNYLKMAFKTGLESVYNDLPSSAHNYLQDTSMWYDPINNTRKYIHLKITGTVDTSLSKNGTEMAPFNISLGGGAINSTILFDNYYTEIRKDENAFIIINVNFGVLFNNIDMLDPANRMITTPGLAISRGQLFLANIPSMFSIF